MEATYQYLTDDSALELVSARKDFYAAVTERSAASCKGWLTGPWGIALSKDEVEYLGEESIGWICRTFDLERDNTEYGAAFHSLALKRQIAAEEAAAAE